MSKVRADNYSNRLGTGAPVFPDGANIAGVCTATSFKGDGSTLSNVVTSTDFIAGIAATFTGNVSIAGTLTYEDVTNVDAIGVITARSGVSIADSIFHTGDTDTSIRFPAADTFAVETAGSERLRVDSSGRLLVGVTTTPFVNDVNFQIYDTTNAKLLLRNPSYGTFSLAVTNDSVLSIKDEANAAERLRINSDGNTLIPGSQTVSVETGKLDIYHTSPDNINSPHIRLWGAANNDARIEFGSPSNTGEGAYIMYNDGDEGMYIGSRMATHSDVNICTGMDDGSPTSNVRLTVTDRGTIFKGGLAEKYENAATTLGAQSANPLADGNVILFSGNESSATLTINFTGVHSTITTGETVSFTAIISPNNVGLITIAQVDGQAIAIKWSGGALPTAGTTGQDVYTFQILKTGTGTSDYTIFGAATNYATV